MQRRSFARLVALAAVCALASCANTGNTAGQTPAPNGTTLAQSNSTAPPEQGMTKGPGSKYFARTANDNGVQFEVWANGQPIITLQTPNQSMEITTSMRGHANRMAIRWTKLKRNGTGTLSITDDRGRKLITASVTASSPMKAGVSKVLIAPQAPSGNTSTNP